MEVMVVIAILLLIVAVMIPATTSVFQLRQRRAAKDLVYLYQQLHDEAVMRNVTFRVVYFIDEDAYKVEVGEPGALIFSDTEEMAEYKQRVTDRLKLMSEDELKEYKERRQPFESLGARFTERFELPAGTVFGGIYTPQYGEMISKDSDDRDGVLLGIDVGEEMSHGKMEQRRVYSYVFGNGFTEHTVVWIVDEDDPTDGFTIEVEPMSGGVRLHGELIEWEDSYDFVPEEGPDLPS